MFLPRILCHLTARADTAYDNAYHHKLRGRLWRALEGTAYDKLHSQDGPPGFVMSNPFPPRSVREGDDRKLLVASHDEELLAHIASDLLDDRELNVGEMPFHVDRVTPIETDVGEPGTSGIIEAGTGVLVRIPAHRCEKYGIDHPGGDTSVFWRPEHTMQPFATQIAANLDRKHNLFVEDYLPGPSDRDGNLFNDLELIKTFSIPVTVTTGQTMTYVLSKWRFGYIVRDDHHRRHLNLALDCGIGERNSLGLGFVNITEREQTKRRRGIDAVTT